LTPAPKLIGRKQLLTPNPVETWGRAHNHQVISIQKKIDADCRTTIQTFAPLDFLLVVDFGYIVPTWLLDLPTIDTINIHPSALPRWRGSSPGQFALLYGDTYSEVCVMGLTAGLDEGPIYHREACAINQQWSAAEYYAHAFSLIEPKLAHILASVASGALVAETQPTVSPTPIARRLSKADAFIPWELVTLASQPNNKSRTLTELLAQTPAIEFSPVLLEAAGAHTMIGSLFEAAVRAFSPWPCVWSIDPDGKRVQFLRSRFDETDDVWVPELVKPEGKMPQAWSQYTQRFAAMAA
jgi:methionyl-tRNA formyltransferase